MSSLLPSKEEMRLGAFKLTDGRDAYLVQASDSFPHVNQLTGDDNVATEPTFKGTPDELLESFKDDGEKQAIKKRLKNKVLKCPNCGKPVAFTLSKCNACAHDLSDVEISYTNNVFTGFIYGVQKGPFPFTISTRYQDKDFLVFDDLLALTACHFNIIRTSRYMSDWRFLLKNPLQGLKLVNQMYDLCCNVLKSQYLANDEWRKAIFNDGEVSFETVERLLWSGFNYPPSQYQLHLQFVVPPLLPFQYLQYQRGLHFTPGRFFPVQYVRAVLALNIPYDVKDNTPIEDIIGFYKARGIDYDVIHKEFYDGAVKSQTTLANWNVSQFGGVVVDKGSGSEASFMPFANDEHSTLGEADAATDAKPMANADKLTIQNYGRPYTEEGKTTGAYYKNAKRKASEMETI